ncbi:MAG: PfkB family carbohydrate kinase [Gemmatimonadales bacterium]
MKLLVVGSVALDSIHTPFGEVTDALGGSAVYFSKAASLLTPVRVVGVVGDDYPMAELRKVTGKDVSLDGVEKATGESFRWRGKYNYDLSARETLETRLGVFANFNPKIPPAFTDSPFVFLGNIHPDLQLSVLDQVKRPQLVACDTMNYWIDIAKDRLMEVLKRVNLLIINDEEIRQLSGDWNVHRAARWVLDRGPERVVVKRGEHGALLVEKGRSFFCPAYPLEEVFDPTGAGDSFAGGFLGYIARTGDTSSGSLRRGMVYGAAMGSFAVSKFSVGGFEGVTPAVLNERVHRFKDLTHFEIAEAL